MPRRYNPDHPVKNHFTTPQRVRFFEAFANKGERTARDIFRDFNMAPSTGYRLLHDREHYGDLADRRDEFRKHKQQLRETRQGPKPKNTDEQHNNKNNNNNNNIIRAPRDIVTVATMTAPVRDALRFPASDSRKIKDYLPPHSSRQPPSHIKPFVTLTFATSLDSQLAIAPGVQTALSGPQSKAMTHFLRSRHDAILIGAGTAIADNPSLNCRIEGVGGYGGQGLVGQPRPVVVDPHGRWQFNEESKVMRLAKDGKGKAPYIVTCVEPPESQRWILESLGGEYLVLSLSPEDVAAAGSSWHIILNALAHRSIESVMIEGGGLVINDILGPGPAYSLVDSIIVTIAPVWLGRGGVQVCPDGGSERLPVTRLKETRWIPLGEDVVLCGRPNQTLRQGDMI
jgi:2,5-diamino-6-(ribosylamino)-4(3H)-pyrimidinone 5'-phosphate reductase